MIARSRPGTTPGLLACGAAGPPLFVAVFLLDGATRPGYDPWRHWVSHLALGDRGWLGAANLVVAGSLMLGFAVGLGRVLHAGPGCRWGPRLVAAFGLGLLLAGVFPIDPGLGYPPGSPPRSGVTWHGQLHDLAGALVFASLAAACFVLSRRSGPDPHRRGAGWRRFSIVAGGVVVVSFLACSALAALDYAGTLPSAPSGLLERVALVAGGAWLTSLALRLLAEGARSRSPAPADAPVASRSPS